MIFTINSKDQVLVKDEGRLQLTKVIRKRLAQVFILRDHVWKRTGKNICIIRQPENTHDVVLKSKGNDHKQKFVFRGTSVDADEEGVRENT